MNNILTIAIKDLRLITRDKMGMFFILGFPIGMALFFGAIAGGVGSSGDAKMSIAVVDEDKSEMSQRFIESIQTNENLDIALIEREPAIDSVRRGQRVGLIAIPEGFGETAGVFWEEGPAIEVGVDPSRTAEAGLLEGLVMQAVGELTMARFQDSKQMKAALAGTQESLAQDPNMPAPLKLVLTGLMSQLDSLSEQLEQIEEEGGAEGEAAGGFEFANIEQIAITRQTSNSLVKKLRSRWDISFPQAMLWGVLGCCAGFAITMVRERTQGTMLRLQVAPLAIFEVLAGKAVACFLSVLGVILVLVALGYGLGMRPNSYSLLAVAAISVAVCFVGVMMLMSVIGKTEEAVGGAAWGANLVMAMFGGGMIPLAFMPGFLRTLSNFSPVKWGILALEGAIWRDFTLAELMFPCLVLIGIGAAAMTLGSLILARGSRG